CSHCWRRLHSTISAPSTRRCPPTSLSRQRSALPGRNGSLTLRRAKPITRTKGSIMAQVGYVCLGTNDFDRACAFWDVMAPELGGKKLFPTPHGVMYRLGAGPMIMITRPYNKEPATVGNGNMLAINVESKEDVARVHARALALGCTTEG